jgi:hypothetical protein
MAAALTAAAAQEKDGDNYRKMPDAIKETAIAVERLHTS